MRRPYCRDAARTLLSPALMLALAALAVVASASADTLRRGAFGEPESLEPRQSGVSSEGVVLLDLFEGLASFGPDGRVVPGAAESWTVADQGRRYIFHLRRGLKWSDGAALTAGDFVFALRRALTPSSAAERAHRLYILKAARAVNSGKADPAALGVQAPDALTLVVDLEAPLPWLPLLLAGQDGVPLPAHTIERYGKEWTRPGLLVSNGAFALAERRPRGNIRLVRNPNFHDANQVRLDSVVYVPSDDTSSLVNRFRAGELEVNGWPGFAAAKLAALRQELGAQVHTSPLASVRYLRFNLRRAPFDDLRVRTALSLLIDRETLARKVLGGGETPAYRVLPTGLDGDTGTGSAELTGGTQASRIARARALLAQAHFQERHPAPVSISVPNGNLTEACIAVAAMWTAAGVPSRLAESEIKSMIADLRRGAFEIALTGAQDVPTAEAYLERFESGASYNTGGYHNPQFEALLSAARLLAEPKARAAALLRAEEALARDHPVAPLIQEVSRSLVSARVRGWVDNSDDIHLSRYLSLAPR